MSSIKLNVPLQAQEKPCCCWETSAFMIWLYWQGVSGRQGPMNVPGSIYARSDRSGIEPQEFITLASTVGLKALPSQNLYTGNDLYDFLDKHGPLWCAGYWFGPGHVIVLTGIDGGQVFFNDPDGGVKKQGTIDWFNQKLANSLLGCLMCKDPDRY